MATSFDQFKTILVSLKSYNILFLEIGNSKSPNFGSGCGVVTQGGRPTDSLAEFLV